MLLLQLINSYYNMNLLFFLFYYFYLAIVVVVLSKYNVLYIMCNTRYVVCTDLVGFVDRNSVWILVTYGGKKLELLKKKVNINVQMSAWEPRQSQ